MIRSIYPADLDKIKEIHEKYYKEEFELPNFYDKFLCAFAVVEDNKIISAGGVRTLLESVIVTDRSKSVRTRRKALYEILQASVYVARKSQYGQIHASIINDPKWEAQLKTIGFNDIKGNMLVLGVE